MTAGPFIIGAGGWGTALAVHCVKRGLKPCVWAYEASEIAAIRATHRNETFLPGVDLPAEIEWTNSLDRAKDFEFVFFVTPSRFMRDMATKLRAAGVRDGAVLLNCSKGIEQGTGLRLSQIVSEVFPGNPCAALSGPSHAEEVARGIPAAVTAASPDESVARVLQKMLTSSTLRIYTSTDVAGVEFGGALKNIFAIAAGVSDGLGLGDNAKAALVTRSLAELARLGVAMGGQHETFYGLSGVGDLMVTCFSRHSRNRGFGEKLGRGQRMEEILAASPMVVEGVPATESAFEQARRLGVDTPVIDQVHALLFEGRDPAAALQELMTRAPKAE